MNHKRNGSTSFTIPRSSLDVGSFSRYLANIKPRNSPKKVGNTTTSGPNITTHTIGSFNRITNATVPKYIFNFKANAYTPKKAMYQSKCTRNPRQISLKAPIKVTADTDNFNTINNTITMTINNTMTMNNTINTHANLAGPNITICTTTPDIKVIKTEICHKRSNSSIPNDTDRKSFAKFIDNDEQLNFVNVMNDISVDEESIQEIYRQPTKKTEKCRDTVSMSSNSSISESLIQSDKFSISRYGTNNLFNNKIVSIRSTPYDLSTRLVNDEPGHQNNLHLTNKMKMLEAIKEEVKFKVISSKKFLQVPDIAMYNILSYSYNFYDKLCQHKLIRKKFYITLINQFSECVGAFRTLYSDNLELQEYYFKPTYINRTLNNQGIYLITCLDLVLDLVFKSKVITNKYNICSEMSVIYNYINGTDEVIQTWRYDIRKKKDIHFWFASETEEVNTPPLTHSIKTISSDTATTSQ
jgi:hypothetical protein